MHPLTPRPALRAGGPLEAPGAAVPGTAALAFATLLAGLAAPTLPWHGAAALIVLAAAHAARPHLAWPMLGAATLWPAAARGPAGIAVLVAAILAVAVARRPPALAIVGVALVVAAKQLVAARVLPAAMEPVPALVVACVAAAGGASMVRGARAEAVGLALAGAVGLARLGALATLDGEARLAAAARVGAVPLVVDGLVEGADPRLLLALVRAAPDRDAAALALGPARALDAGWRPRRADGVVLEVARALEVRSRGGEARRLLARHPRIGEVDGLLALFERTQGEPVRWRGGVVGAALPGVVARGVDLSGGWAHVELTATGPLDGLVLDVVPEATPAPGSPTARPTVSLDGAPPLSWPAGAPLRVPGPLAAGPHRLTLVGPPARAPFALRIAGAPAPEASSRVDARDADPTL